ncbi:MAG: hypothetical protein K6F00_04235 [Lachnospiraceae bacterium]|nr:hypothetical protein [Lachnospiraceae bacterium]
MSYEYEIYGKSAAKRWIAILSNDNEDCDKPDAYINFVEKVNASGDDMGFTFNWDPTFCISVLYPENVSEEQAISFLNRFVG